MSQEEFLARLAERLDTVGIPFMVTGSIGSSFHGRHRATQHVDLVIDPTAEQLDVFVELIRDRYYVSPEAAHDALRRRSMFNIIDLKEGWKADLIIRKDRPFSVEEFQRRKIGTLQDRPMPVASAEDIILSKLEWNTITPSDRQLQDALNVALVQGPKLDKAYLRKWAPSLGLEQAKTVAYHSIRKLFPGKTLRTAFT
jgi:hypothetical protein